MQTPDSRLLGDLGQRVLFLFGGLTFWGAVLLGIQAVFVPKSRTTGNNVLIAMLAVVALACLVAYRVRKLRGRPR